MWKISHLDLESQAHGHGCVTYSVEQRSTRLENIRGSSVFCSVKIREHRLNGHRARSAKHDTAKD